MKDKKEIFFAFLDERKQAITEESDKLAKEDRKDESNVLRARANIYDIFKAIWSAAERVEGDEAFCKELLTKIEQITSPWGKSLLVAKEHDDIKKIMIEEAKLSAVDEAKEKLLELMEK